MTARKRILITTLSTILLAVFLLTPAAADTQKQIVPNRGLIIDNEPIASLQEQYQQAVDSGWSDEMLETLASQIAFMELSENERTASVTSDTPQSRAFYAYHVLSVQQFNQEDPYYCVPAVMQQTINFLTDGAICPSQNTLATILGTTTTGANPGTDADQIVPCLAQYSIAYTIVPGDAMTTREIVNYVVTDIESYEKPPIAGIYVPPFAVVEGVHEVGWHYQTGGHVINVSEIYQMEPECEESKFYIVDPLGPSKGQLTWDYYFVDAQQFTDCAMIMWW